MNKNDFMNYMGFRNMVVEEKIEECLDQIRSGSDHIKIDRGDLTDDEVKQLEKEVIKRASHLC